MLRAFPTAVIENLRPLIDGGRYPIKRVVGEDLAVQADIFKDGHDVVAAVLKWRVLDETHWHETAMALLDNDRWGGTCCLYENEIYEYTVEAWTDTFRGWRHEFATKFKAGITNLQSEALEGAKLLGESCATGHKRRGTYCAVRELVEKIWTADYPEINTCSVERVEVLMSIIRIGRSPRSTLRRHG